MKATDGDLLGAWRNGDRAAGSELFSRYFPSVLRFFRNKLDDVAAEDLTQSTFAACVGSRDALREGGSFRAYLFRIARNELYTHFRRKGVHDAVFDFASVSVADLAAGPCSLIATEQEHALVLEALRSIPVDFQIAVELYYWEGMPTDDLARVLEVPAGTVRSRLARAREQIAERLVELGGPSVPSEEIGRTVRASCRAAQ